MEDTICLDTDKIISYIKNKDSSKILQNRDIGTTCINIFELSCWESPDSSNQGQMKNIINDLKTYDLTKEISISAGNIWLDLIKQKIDIDFKDILIGSICIKNNLNLLTNNIKHFEPMKKFGLKIL
jgi:tRNA(fMet)-specific endonuclease VapC